MSTRYNTTPLVYRESEAYEIIRLKIQTELEHQKKSGHEVRVERKGFALRCLFLCRDTALSLPKASTFHQISSKLQVQQFIHDGIPTYHL